MDAPGNGNKTTHIVMQNESFIKIVNELFYWANKSVLVDVKLIRAKFTGLLRKIDALSN